MPCDRSSIECCLIEPRVHEPRATWIFLEKREREKMRRVRVPESAGKAGVSKHNRNHSPEEAERNENKNQKKKKEKRKKKKEREKRKPASGQSKVQSQQPAASSRQLRTAHSAESGERARNYRLQRSAKAIDKAARRNGENFRFSALCLGMTQREREIAARSSHRASRERERRDKHGDKRRQRTSND